MLGGLVIQRLVAEAYRRGPGTLCGSFPTPFQADTSSTASSRRPVPQIQSADVSPSGGTCREPKGKEREGLVDPCYVEWTLRCPVS